jgi:hypothetical protein
LNLTSGSSSSSRRSSAWLSFRRRSSPAMSISLRPNRSGAVHRLQGAPRHDASLRPRSAQQVLVSG